MNKKQIIHLYTTEREMISHLEEHCLHYNYKKGQDWTAEDSDGFLHVFLVYRGPTTLLGRRPYEVKGLSAVRRYFDNLCLQEISAIKALQGREVCD